MNLLMDLREQNGLTYLLISHDLSMVKHVSDRILVMYLGEIVEESGADELYAQPLHPYTKGLLSAIPVPNIDEKRQRIIMKGEITSPVNPAPCCRFAGRCPYATDLCRQKQPEIEEVQPGHLVACHRVREINQL